MPREQPQQRKRDDRNSDVIGDECHRVSRQTVSVRLGVHGIRAETPQRTIIDGAKPSSEIEMGPDCTIAVTCLAEGSLH